jgi:hypothetical protein
MLKNDLYTLLTDDEVYYRRQRKIDEAAKQLVSQIESFLSDVIDHADAKDDEEVVTDIHENETAHIRSVAIKAISDAMSKMYK